MLSMKVKINAPKIKLKTGTQKIKPNAESLEITPSKDAQSFQGLYDNVSVSGDNNLTAENIKKDVSIFGVEGRYEPEAQSLLITPTKEQQNYEGLYNTVSVVGEQNLSPENIKKDISMYGVIGTFEGGKDFLYGSEYKRRYRIFTIHRKTTSS